MPWNVDLTPEAQRWFDGLPRPDRNRVGRQIDKLRAGGPALGRPVVDSVKGSRHRNMKELRVPDSPLRALFAFGPDRRAIMLTGGSKAGNEKRWYRSSVRVADRLLSNHLATFERGSTWAATRAGNRSGGRQI